jgi:hypothetical protein
MSVEIEEVRAGNYFALGREVIKITEEHYPILLTLSQQLQPLRIQSNRLTKLGFNLVRPGDFNNWTRGHNGMPVFLKSAANNRWILQFTGYEKVRIVEYIHQLQNIWFWLFSEPLQKKEDQPQEQATVAAQPVYTNGRMQPFYLTWDCRFLICAKPHVLWLITEERPLFEQGGKKWGLKLIQGQAPNILQDQAVEWLKKELRRMPAPVATIPSTNANGR